MEFEEEDHIVLQQIRVKPLNQLTVLSCAKRTCRFIAISLTLAMLNLVFIMIMLLWFHVESPVLSSNINKPIHLTTETQQYPNQSLQIQDLQNLHLNIQPIYIWLGDLPEHHRKKLSKLKYNFRLIRECDSLLAKMEGDLMQKFIDIIYTTVNLKSDICRMIVLYYDGGLYLDVDTTVNMSCLNNFLQGKRIFFQATPENGIDIFAIYSAKPRDPQILKAIRSYNTLKSLSKNEYTAMTKRIDWGAKIIAKSGCITHIQERSWMSEPPK